MSLIGKMLADHVHAIDLLCDTKRVDSARIGVAGHGMGGCNALFLASFDERVQACVASCAFTRFADDPHVDRWLADNGFCCLPKLQEAVKTRKFPFDWEHLLGLSAPSPTLLLTALNDTVLSKTRSCEKATKLARNVYRLLGEEEALCNFEHRDGHSVSEEGLAKTDEWFERWL
jgi:cephalosporin-C deacetylase-like acetyl esterase